MRKCPSCGRSYSDMVEQCPSCNVALSEAREQVISDSPKSATNRQTASTGGSGDKIAKIIYIVVAVIAVVLVAFLDVSMAMMLGAVGMGFVLGLIPKKVAESKGKQELGKIALAVTTLANELFGLYASIPTLVILIIVSIVT